MKNMFVCSGLILCFVLLCAGQAGAQKAAKKNQLWNGRECTVVLSYDDALPDHFKNVIPALDSVGLKGTFFVTALGVLNMGDYVDQWRKVAAGGHELGNHTMFHPCTGEAETTDWITPEKDNNLGTYSLARITNEIMGHNILLKAIDGRAERTFAFPCGHRTAAGGQNYYYGLRHQFVAARGTNYGIPTLEEIDFDYVPCIDAAALPAEKMISLIEEAASKNALIVFMFHSVGGDHYLNTEVGEHSKLVRYLKKNEKRIWTTTFLEATKNAKQARGM